jgi:hypothetical protein
MNNQALLHQVFEERLPSIMPAIVLNGCHDEDHIQEGLLGMWVALKKDPSGTNRFLKNNALWNMVARARRGKSVDYPAKSFQRRKFSIKIVNADAFSTDVSDAILEDRSVPVDEKVIAKISWERFIKSLGRLEKRFVKAKLKDGLTTPQVCQKLSIKPEDYYATRKIALGKFRVAFA